MFNMQVKRYYYFSLNGGIAKIYFIYVDLIVFSYHGIVVCSKSSYDINWKSIMGLFFAVNYTDYNIKSKSSWCSKTGHWNVSYVEGATGQGFLFNEGISQGL